jgi:hypothetical protein
MAFDTEHFNERVPSQPSYATCIKDDSQIEAMQFHFAQP